MNTARYIKILSEVKGSGSVFVCPYCGARTLGVPSGAICINCFRTLP